MFGPKSACRPLCLLLCTIALFAIPASTAARNEILPRTHLRAVYPAGGQPGTTVRVEIAGDDLDNVDRLVFSHPGITARAVYEAATPVDEAPRRVPNVFDVDISVEVPTGFHDARAIGDYGVSNPRSFVVDTLRQTVVDRHTADAKPHDLKNAHQVRIGSVTHSQVTANRADYYRFSATAGESVVIECAGQRIDSQLDATLVLYDAAGKELQRVRDTLGYDPVLAFRVPADGEYKVAVYDFLYRGGDDYFYRLAIHRRPLITAVFPPAATPGETSRFTLYGFNLPGGTPVANSDNAQLQQANVDIAAPPVANDGSLAVCGHIASPGAMLDAFAYRVASEHGPSNAIMIGLATAPLVREAAENDQADSAQSISLPATVVGQFESPGDQDWITLRTSAGELVRIEVLSHRTGADTDPTLLVQEVTTDAEGREQVKQLTRLDDDRVYANRTPTYEFRSRDPTFEFTAKEGAVYRVLLRDIYNITRGDPQMTYQLRVGGGAPDFRLVANSHTFRRRSSDHVHARSLVLRQNSNEAIEVHVFRRFGFAEPIEITAEGLPEGVTCHGAIVSGRAPQARLVFSVGEQVPAVAVPIRVVGRAIVDGRQVIREARPATLAFTTENPERIPPPARLAQRLWLSVIEQETSPAEILVENEKLLETSLGSEMMIPYRVARRGNFKSNLQVAPEGLPRQLRFNEMNTPREAGSYKLRLGSTRIPPGDYTFFLRGAGRFRYERNTRAVAAARKRHERFERLAQEAAHALAELKQAPTEVTQLAEKREGTGNDTAGEDPLNAGENQTTDDEARLAHQQQRQELEARLALIEQRRAEAAAELKRVEEANQAGDTDFAIVSKPYRLRVHASPVFLELPQQELRVAAGRSVELPLGVERKFGFSGRVTVDVIGSNDVTAEQVVLQPGASEVKLVLRATENAVVGSQECKVRARVQFSGLNLATVETISVRVESEVIVAERDTAEVTP